MVTVHFADETVYEAKFAEISVLTGRFSAALITDKPMEMLLHFTGAESFYTVTPRPGETDKREDYAGYNQLISLSLFDGCYYIVLDKEATGDAV